MMIRIIIGQQVELDQIDKFMEMLAPDHRPLFALIISSLLTISFAIGILKTSIIPLLSNISVSRSKIIEQRLQQQANQRRLLELESRNKEIELAKADLRTQINNNRERISELLSIISNKTDDFHQLAETLKMIERELKVSSPDISRVMGLVDACLMLSQNSAKQPNSIRRFDESDKF